MNIETMVHVEIQERLEAMSNLDVDTDEYKANMDAVLKLVDRASKMEELNIKDKENEIKLKQMNEDRKDRRIKNVLTAAGIVVPPAVALLGAWGFSIIERTEIIAGSAPREFMKRVLRV